MTDAELADEIIQRLNTLIKDKAARQAIYRLIETRIVVSKQLDDHPTIQVIDGQLGFLGLLNGIVGTIPEGDKKGWGYVTAKKGWGYVTALDKDQLEGFIRTQ